MRRPATRLGVEALENRITPADAVQLVHPLASAPFDMIAFKGRLYFSGDGGDGTGRQLWKSDGTTAGTERLTSANAGPGIRPHQFTVVGDTLYFTADDGVHGCELWSTDGDSAQMVEDLNPGPAGAFGESDSPDRLVNAGGELYARVPQANGTFEGRDQLFYIPTPGTGLLPVTADENNTGTPHTIYGVGSLVANGSTVYFGPVFGANDALWATTDGTPSGTFPIHVSRPTPPYSPSTFVNPVNAGGIIYFADSSASPSHEWLTTGTAETTRLLADPAAGNGYGGHTSPALAVGSSVYFLTYTNGGPAQLWTADLRGEALLDTLDTVPVGGTARLLAVSGTTAYISTPGGFWVYDGTARLIKPGVEAFSATVVGPVVYFNQANSINGDVLWRTDGTEPGTTPVKFSPAVPTIQYPDAAVVVAGATIFASGYDGLYKIGTDTPLPPGSVTGLIPVGAGDAPRVQFYQETGQKAGGITPFGGAAVGTRIASADFNADGVPDVVAGTGPGAVNSVEVYDGATGGLMARFRPFPANFALGVYLSVGDLNRDGTPDLVVSPDQGGGPQVLVVSGAAVTRGDLADQLPQGAVLASFWGITGDGHFFGGVRTGVGDINNDGVNDLVVAAGFGGGPRVAVFDGKTVAPGRDPTKLFNDILVFEDTLRNGTYVAAADLDGDGFAELICGGGPGGAPRVRALSGKDLSTGHLENPTVVANFFAGSEGSRSGVRLGLFDADQDGRPDLMTGVETYVSAYTLSASGGSLPLDLTFGTGLSTPEAGIYVG